MKITSKNIIEALKGGKHITNKDRCHARPDVFAKGNCLNIYLSLEDITRDDWYVIQ